MSQKHKDKKILFCTGTGDIEQWCGVSQSTFLVATNIEEFEVSFLTTGPYSITNKVMQAGYSVKTLPFFTDRIQTFGRRSLLGKLHSVWSLAIYWLRVVNYFLLSKPHIIYCATLSAAFLYILPAKLLKIKVVMAIRGEPSNAWHWGLFYRFSDLILPLSKDLENLVLAHPHNNTQRNFQKKTKVISNGIVIPTVEEVPEKKELTLLYIGIFDERKGQLDFIERVIPKITTDCTIKFAGSAKRQKDKEYENQCHLRAKEIESDKVKIHFLGFVENIKNLYQSVDIVVLASKSEGQPRTVIEGMAFGKPVICYEVTSVRALVEKNKAGYVVENGDAEEMANRINELNENIELREQMGARGKDFIKQNLSIDAIAREHEDVFQLMF